MMSNKPLKNKVTLITGASTGIGRATAKVLARAGAQAIINFIINKEQANQVAAEIKAGGGEAIALRADVSRREEVEAMIQEAEKIFGSIDILVNNAAAKITRAPTDQIRWEDFEKELNVVLRGAYNATQAVVPKMKEKKYGKIVNILTAYILGAPPKGIGAYVVAKEALLGLTKATAVDLHEFGIRINAISPGPTDTDLWEGVPKAFREIAATKTPLGRFLQPEEVAEAVLFLASPESDYLNGENLPLLGKFSPPLKK